MKFKEISQARDASPKPCSAWPNCPFCGIPRYTTAVAQNVRAAGKTKAVGAIRPSYAKAASR